MPFGVAAPRPNAGSRQARPSSAGCGSGVLRRTLNHRGRGVARSPRGRLCRCCLQVLTRQYITNWNRSAGKDSKLSLDGAGPSGEDSRHEPDIFPPPLSPHRCQPQHGALLRARHPTDLVRRNCGRSKLGADRQAWQREDRRVRDRTGSRGTFSRPRTSEIPERLHTDCDGACHDLSWRQKIAAIIAQGSSPVPARLVEPARRRNRTRVRRLRRILHP